VTLDPRGTRWSELPVEIVRHPTRRPAVIPPKTLSIQ
jgi:hypothetical protein